MATKKVHIDILAKDRTRQALKGVQNSLNRVKNSVFSLKGALVGLGAGLVVRSFLKTGREIENLKVRFKFLFDTVEEGNKAFKGLIKFASSVPFQLKDIQRGAANLAVVSDSAEEMGEMLKIAGDIATVSGLDFATTAEQLQRVFSSGIASADLFRERGVKDMLGFEAGVRYSAEQSKEHIITAFRDSTIAIAGASAEMAKTFDGQVSMIMDKWLLFKVSLLDAGPYEFLKSNVQALEIALSKSFGTIEKAAEHFGFKVVEAVKAIVLGGASVVDALAPIFSFLMGGINEIVKFTNNIPPWLKGLGIIGFLALGTTGKLVVMAVAVVYNRIVKIFEALMNFVIRSTDKIAKAVKKLGFDETAKQLQSFSALLSEVTPKMVDNLENWKKGFEEASEVALGKVFSTDDLEKNYGSYRALIQKYFDELDIIMSTRVPEFDTNPVDDSIKKTKKELTELGKAVEGFKTGWTTAMDEAANMSKRFEEIGKTAFNNLKKMMTDFVMTGKLQFEDFARTITRMIVEALIGKAVSAAIDKAVLMWKASALREAMMSVYAGALKTFSSIPWPWNMVAVAGAIATGMKLVNKIKGFEQGGRPPINQPSMVGEKGPELFIPDRAGTIVPNNQLGGKPVTVNFNINTVDARGFNELLVNSRGVIVNMINSAVNEKGRMAIV